MGTIKIKRTTTAGTPTTANATSGEMVYQENAGLKKLFIGNVAGTAVNQIAGDGYAFASSPTAPTPTQGDNSTTVATTAYVDTGLATKANKNLTTASAFVGTDSSGNIAVIANSSATNGGYVFTSATANQPINFQIGGGTQTNNTSTVATTLNLSAPIQRQVALLLNAGSSCTILSLYNGGAPAINFQILRNGVVILNFNSSTDLNVVTRINSPVSNSSARQLYGVTTLTATGTVTTPITFVNSSSAVTVNLPTSPITGETRMIANIGSNTATITPASGTISGSATLVLSAGQSCTLVFTGTNWNRFSLTTV